MDAQVGSNTLHQRHEGLVLLQGPLEWRRRLAVVGCRNDAFRLRLELTECCTNRTELESADDMDLARRNRHTSTKLFSDLLKSLLHRRCADQVAQRVVAMHTIECDVSDVARCVV